MGLDLLKAGYVTTTKGKLCSANNDEYESKMPFSMKTIVTSEIKVKNALASYLAN